MLLRIKDLPGRIPVAEMRRYFERAINDTPSFKANTPLGTVEINGQFSHYFDADTDTMWLGFAIGMRCAERLASQAAEERKS